MKKYYRYEEFINNLDAVKKELSEGFTELPDLVLVSVRVDSKAQYDDICRINEDPILSRVRPTMYPGWFNDYTEDEMVPGIFYRNA
jgi:hypothetical protein